MCGIVGIIYSDPERPVPPHLLGRMLQAIEHRGPDDEGTFFDGSAALGMRRLSIIDVASGHQPIFDESRRRVIVFNGEIYNYRDLRSWLDGRGHHFRTNSDTETIVHLHEELGDRCVERLRGMFGFALWDTEEKELLLARDRFGIKPMYVVTGEWGIAFASELKALHAGGFTGGDLDWAALEALFRVGYIPAPRTPFVGVQKLEPGHVLSWKSGRVAHLRQYWDVPTSEAGPRGNLEEQVRERLDESVGAHLVSDVPVAAFLSGGLDSSAIVASMVNAGSNTHAYTVRYTGSGGNEMDETDLARKLADRYGVRLSVVDVDPDIGAIFEPMVRSLDEPHADASAVPTWLLCERVAQDYKVAMVGTGGDELFGGYRRHFALAAAERWQRLPASFRRAANAIGDRIPEPRNGGLSVGRIKRFLRSSGGSMASRYLSLQDRLGTIPLFTDECDTARESTYTETTFARHGSRAPSDGSVRPALYVDYKTYLPDQLLHLSDRISMAHSLEVRVPFVDHELVETFFPIQDTARVGSGEPKRLLRRSQETRLPPEHLSAPKRGFVGPTAMWLRNELSEMLSDELAPDRLKHIGAFDAKVVGQLVREHRERRHNHEGVLWALLCFTTWHRLFVETRSEITKACA